jgi:predicted nucleotidyltransferase component of viral defense system
MDEVAVHGIDNPFWTFGGGTVLMLRYRHRRSKDIDIFVPDPQYLGHVTPRLSGVAEKIAPDYIEAATFVKLIREEGEIDFVAAENLTDAPFETWSLLRRKVRVETAVEIVAKKLWHRGDRLSARDLFDLSLVIEHEPDALRVAGRFLVRHRAAFLQQLAQRAKVLEAQLDAIDALDYRPTFADAAKRAKDFLRSLPAK